MTEEEYYTYNISNKLYLEEIKFASCNINIPETIIIDANAIEEEFELEDKHRIIDNRKIKKVINPEYINSGQGSQFYYRIAATNYLIYEFISLKINGLDYTDRVEYNEKTKVIDIHIDITPIDVVEISYKQKVYSE